MRRAGDRVAWLALALALFASAIATAFTGFWGADLRAEVPLPRALRVLPDGEPKPTVSADYRLGIWAVSRNAWAFLHRPHRLFDAEPCHPADQALALHHPVLAPAIVALPFWIATGDPILTFNLSHFFALLVAALAMYLLVVDWTREPAAGVVAGLLYAFHGVRLELPHHFFNVDNAWLLLALFFARRLFEHGRWRDAIGLGVAGVLQMASSVYPFVAALAVALPFAAWLVFHYGPRRVPLAPLALAAAIAAAGAAMIFLPYLELEGRRVLSPRSNVLYAPWSRLLPGGSLFPGWVCLLLLVPGMALPRRRALAGLGGDPRPALAVGVLLVLALATGGNVAARMGAFLGGEPPPVVLPNLFGALRNALPGLAIVRLPGALAPCAVQIVCLLAGLGAAGVLRSLPRRAFRWAAALLIAAAWIDTLRPSWLGLEPAARYTRLHVRPAGEAIDLFRQLERLGNSGPVLELPIDFRDGFHRFVAAPAQHLLSAYHHRRTSGCKSSFVPPSVQALRELGALDSQAALSRARSLGFTTVVVHHRIGDVDGERFASAVGRAARDSGGGLEPLIEGESMSAFALRPKPGEPNP